MLEREGKVDVLVNNAGIGGTGGAIEEQTDEQWLKLSCPPTCSAPCGCARRSSPSMREQGVGTIINVSSIAGLHVRHALHVARTPPRSMRLCSVSDLLTSEGQDFGIRVACIEPGFFATQVLENATIPDPTGSPYESMARAVQAWYRTSIDVRLRPAPRWWRRSSPPPTARSPPTLPLPGRRRRPALRRRHVADVR